MRPIRSQYTKIPAAVFTRWILLLLAVFYFLLGKSTNNYFPAVSIIAIAYNILNTLVIIKRNKNGKTPPFILLITDAMFVSSFVYFMGGKVSELFIFYVFIIIYSGIIENPGKTIWIAVFSSVVYIGVCMAAGGLISLTEYFTLFFRGFSIMASAFGIIKINNEVRHFDQLHKKEFKRARTDGLTGLANRHYFEQKLSDEVELAQMNEETISILMFDLDNFKNFNDTYGHVWGDKLLTLFSDIIRQNIRKTDIPVRYGGEEFLIMIRGLDLTLAGSVAERIRKHLEKQRIYINNKGDKHKVTVSCGVAQYPKHGQDIRKVVELADKALYEAKGSGKNVVFIYDNGVVT